MLEQGLVALLVANTPLTALVGTRIYPITGPPDNPTYPYITYQPVTGHSDYTLDIREFRSKRIQFDIWSTGSLSNLHIMIALRNALSGYSGTLQDGTRVLFTERLTEMADFDNDSKSWRSVVDYGFYFVEA